MREDELEWIGAVTGERSDDCVKGGGLDGVELERLRHFAEHPELADPLIGLLPRRPGAA